MKTVMNARNGRLFLDTEEWKKITYDGKSFVSRLLRVNPAERMNAQECTTHPWISKYQVSLEKIYLDKHLTEWNSPRGISRASPEL